MSVESMMARVSWEIVGVAFLLIGAGAALVWRLW